MSIKSKKSSDNRRQFLLTFFNKEEVYSEIEVNGFWLIKHWDGGRKIWTVDIYPEESYRNHKSATQQLFYS